MLRLVVATVACLIGLVALDDGRVRAPQSVANAIALTFDDLPFANVGGGEYLAAARRTTTDILRVLSRHQAPAIGFVNERQLDTPDRDDRVALLKQWIDAGMTLGNHTYSHPDFNTVTVDRFKEEIVKGEVSIRALMAAKPGGLQFFRHPMTHTGETAEKKQAIDEFLRSRGYRIAPHTIENSDFIFNAVYVRALNGGDKPLAARVRTAYLEFTSATTAFAQRIAPQVFGRPIPQTLLLHANTLNADALDDLLTRYRADRFHFITLEGAMGDPAYGTNDTVVTTYGPTWLWRWNKSLGKDVSFRGDPEPPAWVMEAYNRR